MTSAGGSGVRPGGESSKRQLLDVFGLSARAEAAYIELLSHGSVASLQEDLREELAEAGLIGEEYGTVVTHSAVQRMRDRGEQAIALARQAFDVARELEFIEQGRTVSTQSTRSHERIVTMFNHTLASAQGVIRAFDRPPYFSTHGKQAPQQIPTLQRGVENRVIYAASALQHAGIRQSMREAIAQGEQARVAANLPFRMIAADEQVAFLMREDADGIRFAARVSDPVLMAMLIDLFDLMWETGVPVPGYGDQMGDLEEPTMQTRELLTYLATGMTDDAIAEELGISARTVARRISRLNTLLSANGRFQLGMQAQRRGWLD